MIKPKVFITGGAGFIGCNLTQYFLKKNFSVTAYDNLSNGKEANVKEYLNLKDFYFIKGDIKDFSCLESSISGHDLVIHLASNADIAAAVKNPTIDFDDGVLLTSNVLEAMRINKIDKLIFTSGSGVYGEVPDYPVKETFTPLKPVSTYGAQKLASENFISAYSFMFDMKCIAFRFANVVGPKQTHGVTHDFILRLTDNSDILEILGDGTQTKPFVHIETICSAIETVLPMLDKQAFFENFNVGAKDHITVTKIADLICSEMKLTDVEYIYSGGKRGWKADVPKYTLDTTKLESLGWVNNITSKEAVQKTIRSMLSDVKKGLYA